MDAVEDISFQCIKLHLVPDKIKFLFAGYIRNAESLWNDNNADNPYYKIPSYIQQICLTFYYILNRFDIGTVSIMNDPIPNLIKNDDGTIISNKDTIVSGRANNVGCSVGHKEGIHEYKVRMNKLHPQKWFGLGITSDIRNIKGNEWMYEYKYGFTVYACFQRTAISPWFAGNTKNGQSAFDLENWSRTEFKEGDVITMILDCKNWKISYKTDVEDIGECKIEADLTYYPCISMESMDGVMECELISEMTNKQQD